MTPDFWLERWRRGETGWHLNEINLHLQTFWPRLELPAATRVFVPLCGRTLDMLWLAGRGHRVVGVELSELGVRAFFEEQGLTPVILDKPPFRQYQVDELTLLCGDFFQLTPAHLAGVGAVYDRASLIALPPAMRPRYASHFKRIVPAGASGLLITLDYAQAEMAGPPFAVSQDEVIQLFGDRFRIDPWARLDILDESPNFRQRGLSAVSEEVFRLAPG